MNKFIVVFVEVCLVCVALSHPEKRLLFQVNNEVNVGDIDDRHLNEASGLCASRIHPGILYSHNDHGNHNRLYAIDSRNAKVISVITINGATNEDWEDIACGKCYGHMDDFCIYIGDIGDGGPAQTVYRVVEPVLLPDTLTVSVDGVLRYSWNQADAETLMVTPSAELYIVSKTDDAVGAMVGHLPSQGWATSTPVSITQQGGLTIHTSHPDPVGGDISPDGQEILLKTRNDVLHFYMNGSTDYISVLQGHPTPLPYRHEKHGESVAFSQDGRSYFTLGEGSHEPLYRYDASI